MNRCTGNFSMSISAPTKTNSRRSLFRQNSLAVYLEVTSDLPIVCYNFEICFASSFGYFGYWISYINVPKQLSSIVLLTYFSSCSVERNKLCKKHCLFVQRMSIVLNWYREKNLKDVWKEHEEKEVGWTSEPNSDPQIFDFFTCKLM